MISYQAHTLKNGFRVITAPMHDTKAVSVLFLVGVGSRYETPGQSGLSHFLEHLVFKGTKKRPSNLHIASELDSVGAQYNAYTSEEYTGFFVRASADHFLLALDILADMLWQSTFPIAELEREKGVIVEEINMYRDDPMRHIGDLIKSTVFPGHPLGLQITGTKETVTAMTREHFLDYRRRWYTAKNTILTIAGNPLRNDWLSAIAKLIDNVPDGSPAAYQPFQPHQAGPRVQLEHRSTDQAHFVLALPKFKRTDPRWPAVKVMTNLLGGMMSSRLFTEVREKRGLAYYVNAGVDDFRDTGAIYIRAGVDIKKIDEALKVSLGELARLKTESVPEQELHKTQENLKGNIYLSLEDSLSVAEFLADQALLWGSIDQPEQIVEDVIKVTAHDIMKVANELLVTEKLNLAVVGPYKEEERFVTLLKI